MVLLQNRCAEAVETPYDELAAQLPAQAVLNIDESPTKEGSAKAPDSGFVRATGTAFVDRINESAIFSGVNRKLMTKNFQGGKATVIFGGLDLDLTQVDFTGVVTLDLEVGFGGVKLIVPPHWDVRTEMSNIAAGLEGVIPGGLYTVMTGATADSLTLTIVSDSGLTAAFQCARHAPVRPSRWRCRQRPNRQGR